MALLSACFFFLTKNFIQTAKSSQTSGSSILYYTLLYAMYASMYASRTSWSSRIPTGRRPMKTWASCGLDWPDWCGVPVSQATQVPRAWKLGVRNSTQHTKQLGYHNILSNVNNICIIMHTPLNVVLSLFVLTPLRSHGRGRSWSTGEMHKFSF